RRHRVDPVAEDGLLAGRSVRRQPRTQRGPAQPALVCADGPRDPRAQALEGAGLDGLEEDARIEVLRVVRVTVAVAEVRHAVEDPDGVVHQTHLDVPAALTPA